MTENVSTLNTEELLQDRFNKMLDIISNHPTKNEIATFARRRKSIEKFIDSKINPLENEIFEINAKLETCYDELKQMREEMVSICVHPRDLLIFKDDHVLCKFCNVRLGVPKL